MIRRSAVLIAVALVAASCGGGDDEPVAAPNDTAAADDTTAADDAPGVDLPDGIPPRSGVETPADPETGKPSVALPADDPTDLVVFDITEGTGDPAEVGDTVEVNYVGVLSADGTEFDNSYDRGQVLPVTLGSNSVIAGWEQGLVGVKVGGRRQMDIPAALAYGDQGAGGVIPPGAAISFVVDVVRVISPVEFTCPPTDGTASTEQAFTGPPPMCIDETATYQAEIVTNFGTVVVELDPTIAPLTVNNFVSLARYHYFDGTECHRAIPGFVVQCGDPTATGSGGPGYRFADELPDAGEYEIGSLAMANSGPDTNGSQFFIITGEDGAALPPQYSLFGKVIEGLDTTVAAMDEVANPDNNGVPPLEQIIIESVTITES